MGQSAAAWLMGDELSALSLLFSCPPPGADIPARAIAQQDWKAELWERHDRNEKPTDQYGVVCKVFFKGAAFDDKCDDWCWFCLGQQANSVVCREHQVTFEPKELRQIMKTPQFERIAP